MGTATRSDRNRLDLDEASGTGFAGPPIEGAGWRFRQAAFGAAWRADLV
jgi:hypothetical protein